VLERRLPLYRAEVLAAADAGPRETWIRDQLQGLVGRVEDLQIAAARARGWALRAREVRRSSVEDPADAWAAAAVRVAASSRYRDLELSPQLGLLPLGPDQDTGLEEFAVENTGLIPGRDGSGRLVSSPSELIAVVLVLVPGGRARLGAFTDDLDAVSEETRRAITLDPFFIGKWELSQAQWYAMTGHNPARWRSTAVPHGDLSSASGASDARERERWLRPVESVAYHPFVQALRRMGLSIPTEAQWEYAALAGTDSPWWVERERLRDTDNFADGSVDRRRTMYQTEDWDDGHEVTAPVTSMLPNPFGLHHVHGNVSEWTRDAFLDHPGIEDLSSGTGDIVYPPLGARIVVKGGSYTTPARFGRSSARHAMPEGTRSPSLGVRASRPVTP
jgi:formylglycine-generating enzyme required for sulfatase activity